MMYNTYIVQIYIHNIYIDLKYTKQIHQYQVDFFLGRGLRWARR